MPLLLPFHKTHTNKQECTEGRKYKTKVPQLHMKACRRLSTIVSISFVANIFLCSYLSYGKMFPLEAVKKHCLPASLTMQQVTGVSWTPLKIEQEVETHRQKSVNN